MFYKLMIAMWCLTSTLSFAIRVMQGDTVLVPVVGETLATMAGGAAILLQLLVLWLVLFHTTIRER